MIFVTGGTGMVGAHLLYDLVCQGNKVRALIRPKSNKDKTNHIFSYYSNDYTSLFQKIEWVVGDIRDKEILKGYLVGVDQIYHVAAMVSFGSKDREVMLKNNCEGTANLVDLALSLKIPKFCFVSSIAAIGASPDGNAANEECPWQDSGDHSDYSRSKYLSEMEVWRAIRLGLNAVIVNPSVIVGPGDWSHGSPLLFSQVKKGMPFYTKGGTGFVDVRDVARAMQLLMDDDQWNRVKNQRYILNSENLQYLDFFRRVAASLNVAPPKIFAGKGLLQIAVALSALKAWVTRSASPLSRDIVRSASRISTYDGSKITRSTGFQYTPIATSVNDISALFIKDHTVDV